MPTPMTCPFVDKVVVFADALHLGAAAHRDTMLTFDRVPPHPRG